MAKTVAKAVKVVFFGSEESGKSCLLERFARPNSKFREFYEMTTGANFISKRYPTGELVLQCWDTAGVHRFRVLLPGYFRNAKIGVYCVDLTKPLEESKIKQDIDDFLSRALGGSVILVGTKSDLPQANREGFNNLALTYPYDSFVVSTKNREGIDTLFERIYALGKQPTNDRSDLGSVISEVAPSGYSLIDSAIERLDQNTSLFEAVSNLKTVIASLPDEKRSSICREVFALVNALQSKSDSHNLEKAIKDFEKNCNRHLAGKHPVLMAIAKAVAVVVIAALVTVIAGLVGFGIGFAAGAWTGPGAFITGLAAGGAAASAVLGSSGAVGVVATAVSAYGLFKKSPLEKSVQKAVDKVADEVADEVAESTGITYSKPE
jgi:small GTP-binding protein